MNELSRGRVAFSPRDNNNASRWHKIWKEQRFKSWDDANEWLWNVYRAEVRRAGDGFEIRFLYLDDEIMFKLTWL